MKAINLYLHVHQPYRIRHYTIFDVGANHNYFDSAYDHRTSNESIIHKIVNKSYIPTNQRLLDLLKKYPEFRLSLSITGTVLEQLELWSPIALQSFKDLVATGRVEILAETYHHSLSFFYSLVEFEAQVEMHRKKIKDLFEKEPSVFRNTELSYNNDLAFWADLKGYKGILAEGWDPILSWRSPNYIYQPLNTNKIKLLMKNYRLSDDIAFRFGNRNWREWPLTADKYAAWMRDTKDSEIFNLFMDYETFGEHQWDHTGIFEFLERLPEEWLKTPGNTFVTVSEAIDLFEARDRIDIPQTITWADTERDLSAWLGNPMQQQAIKALYELQKSIINASDEELINDWRRLQTSDHFYYMCTKWFNDGDIHSYFSPYESPYEAFMNFMNVWHDLKYRLLEKGVSL